MRRRDRHPPLAARAFAASLALILDGRWKPPVIQAAKSSP